VYNRKGSSSIDQMPVGSLARQDNSNQLSGRSLELRVARLFCQVVFLRSGGVARTKATPGFRGKRHPLICTERVGLRRMTFAVHMSALHGSCSTQRTSSEVQYVLHRHGLA
jgi:hypothetical protein